MYSHQCAPQSHTLTHKHTYTLIDSSFSHILTHSQVHKHTYTHRFTRTLSPSYILTPTHSYFHAAVHSHTAPHKQLTDKHSLSQLTARHMLIQTQIHIPPQTHSKSRTHTPSPLPSLTSLPASLLCSCTSARMSPCPLLCCASIKSLDFSSPKSTSSPQPPHSQAALPSVGPERSGRPGGRGTRPRGA